MRKNIENEFDIVDIEFPGIGIAKEDGKDIYIKGAVPGQRVLARITKARKEYAKGKLIKVLNKIDGEIEPKCPHFEMCGGCTYQFLQYKEQLNLKEKQILKLFKEAGIDGFEYLGMEHSPKEYEYRNKMEFTFGDMEKGGELSLGMHIKNKSFGIVTVDHCYLIHNDFKIILNAVLNYFRQTGLPYYKVMKHEGFLRNLVIRRTENTSELLINIVTTSQNSFNKKEFTDLLMGLKLQAKISGIINSINDSLSDVVAADEIDILYGRTFVEENILGLKFKISPFSFFQTNTLGAEKLYSMVMDFMGPSDSKVIFDLYCGTGTIGQIAAKKAKKVIGIELIEEAVKAATENAAVNGLDNCTFIAGDVAKTVNELTEKPDIIILDPPRPGVHPKALNYVVDFNAQEIIYVSCNPKTLVEDLKMLISNGYVVEKVIGMDMFPNTPHVEVVTLLTRSEGTK
ncbi:23S rRNA (uracil-5-)-methyltransferase RumA [Clostridium acidisoli DSM 12555]|uniref:23S rRNA (Uracil-5-)-methyltransferase RumA n=1 Tax=Clostridium acidisoli DSM 12555 TaxID=1121291 RepID=A0A1W1X5S0_9CLOT|nr:23S rRNA (uracil(1939)-C(5))-methyltransferase RlmD [Clostridium acidisoli]SMC18811.1 23S rRNA (uracil-5-)-methyltransferase RumA [Clostridium acidisoli DSM 12555]